MVQLGTIMEFLKSAENRELTLRSLSDPDLHKKWFEPGMAFEGLLQRNLHVDFGDLLGQNPTVGFDTMLDDEVEQRFVELQTLSESLSSALI